MWCDFFIASCYFCWLAIAIANLIFFFLSLWLYLICYIFTSRIVHVSMVTRTKGNYFRWGSWLFLCCWHWLLLSIFWCWFWVFRCFWRGEDDKLLGKFWWNLWSTCRILLIDWCLSECLMLAVDLLDGIWASF